MLLMRLRLLGMDDAMAAKTGISTVAAMGTEMELNMDRDTGDAMGISMGTRMDC
jgi:hypothetical protein